ncbi:tautomerase family protein [Exiguobacterium sp. RIT452]|uniref:tautomerase family protein n=1 Tax=Exiguobacterium sp. RIT452 TaxID=2315552 RepID=UPI000E770239|nr:tautomerase family protein [Exiguobacterium sp. RIT452]RJO97490.1 tautomerase family protein [Exiguobacterium sp. RIT452]
MPLLRFDVIEGRSDEELKLLLDTAHEAMLEAFDVPERDRYQIVHTHKANEMVIQDTGLGLTRTNHVVLISVTSKTRTKEKKQALYRLLAERLEAVCGLAPSDLMVSIVENDAADWSFGLGKAQFLTGDL